MRQFLFTVVLQLCYLVRHFHTGASEAAEQCIVIGPVCGFVCARVCICVFVGVFVGLLPR